MSGDTTMSGRHPDCLTRLRVKFQPDQIATLRYVRLSYHASFPTAGPQSVSSSCLVGHLGGQLTQRILVLYGSNNDGVFPD